jgi:hypothetical protein
MFMQVLTGLTGPAPQGGVSPSVRVAERRRGRVSKNQQRRWHSNRLGALYHGFSHLQIQGSASRRNLLSHGGVLRAKMMGMEKLESPRHKSARTFLRVAGPVFLALGLVLILIGAISFFAAMNSHEPPRYFWCAFGGMPLAFLGLVFCKFGYMGAVARYMAAEVAPVGKDAVNYMAEGTAEGVKTVARAVTEGIREGRSGDSTSNVQR